PVAWRRRRCSSTTSPSVTYRIRRGAGIAPGSSAGRAWPLPRNRRPESLQVRDCGPSQILRREAETFRLLAQAFSLRRRQVDSDFHVCTVPSRRAVQQHGRADRPRTAAHHPRWADVRLTNTWGSVVSKSFTFLLIAAFAVT